MKSIKHFKYINTYSFKKFLDGYGYALSDAVGFSTYDRQQYHGNILKEYVIYLTDHDHIFFKTVDFKSFNEYYQSSLGFNSNRMLSWYNSANVRRYKSNDRYVIA